MGKWLVLAAALPLAMVIGGTPCAIADPESTVRTQSGNTRCVLHADSVACQYLPGFPQAPVASGSHWDIAAVTSAGAFRWDDANIPGSPEVVARDVVLTYGQLYHLQGWTVKPSEDGTRFTNEGSGRGMFVSIDNVYSF
jgi:hypothetical protein